MPFGKRIERPKTCRAFRRSARRGSYTKEIAMRNRRFQMFAVLGLVAVGLVILKLPLSHAADPAPGAIYAQLSSPDSQMPAGGPLVVKMSSNDALAGLTHDDKGNSGEIKVTTPGA